MSFSEQVSQNNTDLFF